MPARPAKRPRECAVHMNDIIRPGVFVQAVYVLRDDDDLSGPIALQPHQSLMRGIGAGLRGLGAAGIVESVNQTGVSSERFWCRHILDPMLRPQTALIPEGAKTALCRYSGPCQNYDLSHLTPGR